MEHKKLIIGVLVILAVAGVVGVSASAPDASSAHSQGVQKLVLQVPGWQQVNSNGFGDPQTGDVTALAAFNGYFYAGIHNPTTDAQIFRSPDGVTWTPVTEPGFGISHDIAPPAILDLTVFNGKIYATTGRGGDPGQIYRSLVGVGDWAPMVIYGFSDQDNVDITALAEYNGLIYAGVTNLVTGAQIWRSFTGDNNSWEHVAPAVVGTDVASVTGFAVFDGALYAAVESEAPAQIWRSYGGIDWTTEVSDGFGDSNTTSTGGMAVFAGYLYVGAGNTDTGAQLWRTSDGAIWEGPINPGFGDANNEKVEMVYVFQNQLYVSLKNVVTGMELWRSPDGSSWEQANLDGFGDSNNSGSNWSNATADFLGQLYVGTSNVVDGGELWRMQQHLTITKTVETTHTPVLLGDAITYTVVIANSGDVDATGVRVTDTLPVGVTGVDLDWTGTVTAADQVAFTVPALVTTSAAFYAQTITNTTYYTHTSGSGSDTASFTIERGSGPNLSGSTKAASPSNQRLMPGDLVTYTITLNNSGGMDASVALTDVLRSYYTVHEATGWVESPTGTLTWSGPVQAGQQVVLQFVARVVDVAGLPVGKTTLGNTLSVDDGVNPVSSVQDASPPWVEIYSLYLPLVLNNQ
jgi:uncharacterized repeat protein (TIGR01451 family)